MALITNYDTSIFPYNDSSMVYDLSLRQYKLTVSGVKDILGYDLIVDMGTLEEAQYFMNEISDIVYNHIYSYANVTQIDVKRYQIAKDEDLREVELSVFMSFPRFQDESSSLER